MPEHAMTVALISEVFYQDDGPQRLVERLTEAREAGAELAVLPELPLNPWSPATRQPRDDDAEGPEGPRHQVQREAAAKAEIGLVGGAIVIDRQTGQRRNRALIFDPAGDLIASYDKAHVPEEPGFWETSHYDPGTEPPAVIDRFTMPLGVQICSDINRPEGSHLLGAAGAEIIICPRATELATVHRWRPVFCANAITSTSYVLSVNRPAPEQDVLIGGPSFAIAPDGSVMVESTERLVVVILHHDVIAQARTAYPGYLPVRADLYARGWSAIQSATSKSAPGQTIAP